MCDNLTEVHPLLPGRQESVGEVHAVMVILSLLSLLGVAGNAVVLYVFSQRSDRLVSTTFILTLAVVDMMVSAVVIPYTVVMEYVNYNVRSDAACRFYYFLITSNIPFSAFIMVAIALDRYFCICRPFVQAMNIFRAKVIIAFLAVVVCVMGVIVALIHGATCVLVRTHARANDTHVRVYCRDNTHIVPAKFQMYYQKFYSCLFPACLGIIVVLYVIIYCSVRRRRRQRQREKSRSLYIIQAAVSDSPAEHAQTCEMSLINVDRKDVTSASVAAAAAAAANNGTAREKSLRKMSRDRLRMANMRTAAMLFVVTVVFFVTFFPAFLMVLGFIPSNTVVFYMYFANNVANPVIYSFMNKTFRDDLRKLFCKRRYH